MCKTAVPKALTRVVSWDELAKHASPTDLWVAIEGLVYDVTAWRKQHPGGWRLLEVRALTHQLGGWGAYGCFQNTWLRPGPVFPSIAISHFTLIESYLLLPHSRVSRCPQFWGGKDATGEYARYRLAMSTLLTPLNSRSL